ncbi:DNA-3-methyladenine glycosylase family protein [Cupriavidus pauculus]|uniref:DNA-3-methyladenine glycosylase family protein n=1 Tax=Cupriavidus pauculus TaxID=82633 RepID=UPI001BA703FD|nr:DNA-3-methyladenine glycosylase [Cupriavidus pauculus]MCM3606812.1 DNA-3-methyladenine glycosylase [Cupriavidus pauculus]UAK99159.1 DNA-3-methyladenine glycosylase [Cupriavidus pauculus]
MEACLNAVARKPKTAAAGPRPAGKTAAKQAPKVSAKSAAKVAAKAAAPARAGAGKGRKPELPEASAVPLPVETVVDAVRPAYWDEACADLMKRDRILRKMIPTYGPAHLVSRGDPFVTLARSIVGQQISVKAAQSVWERLVTLCPRLTPAQFLKAGTDQLAGCGLSKRKAEYITDLAEHFKAGSVHVNEWSGMDDEAVIAELTQIRGIGRWTAEMFLMFNLMRPNVLPLDDVGLINAISANYFSGEPVTRSEAREVAANWEPWRTVATWYMWRSLDPLPVTY